MRKKGVVLSVGYKRTVTRYVHMCFTETISSKVVNLLG